MKFHIEENGNVVLMIIVKIVFHCPRQINVLSIYVNFKILKLPDKDKWNGKNKKKTLGYTERHFEIQNAK